MNTLKQKLNKANRILAKPLRFFFNWYSLHARLITATTRHGVTRKGSAKRLSSFKSYLERTYG